MQQHTRRAVMQVGQLSFVGWGSEMEPYRGTGVGRWLLGGLGDERAASRWAVDGKIDHTLDVTTDRLYELMSGKLGADPALAKL
jgi:hypothetical protein